jgi:PRTRC genetic system protein B
MKTLRIPKGLKPEAVICIAGDEFVLIAQKINCIVQKIVAPGAVRQAFAAQPVDSGWLPQGINRWGSGPKGQWMLRWHPPAMRPVALPGRKTHARIAMPALVFFGQGTHYYIWAMKGEKFDPRAHVFNAPCANVNTMGLICWGTNPKREAAVGFEAMWKLFWEAPFSTNWSNGKSKKHPNAVNAMLIELAKSKTAKYPEDDLVPLQHRLISASGRFNEPITLDQLVELITRRGDQWD